MDRANRIRSPGQDDGGGDGDDVDYLDADKKKVSENDGVTEQ
jgi:hypothetical protein